MKIGLITLCISVLLTGCSGMSLKGASSLSVDVVQPYESRHNLATAQLFLSREYGNSELNVGLVHHSDPDRADMGGGTNGIFVEIETTLMNF